jgi:hypothetical protein
MVTQQFAMPSYPPPVPQPGLVQLLRFMFPDYDWESDSLAGFNRQLAAFRDLQPYNGNYNLWFDRKFCQAYGAWTFYTQVKVHNHLSIYVNLFVIIPIMYIIWHECNQ